MRKPACAIDRERRNRPGLQKSTEDEDVDGTQLAAALLLAGSICVSEKKWQVNENVK